MASPLRELLAVLGINVDTEELDKADKKIDGFLGKLKGAGSVFLEALGAEKVGEFFKSQVEHAAHIQDLSERLGVTAEQIKSFGFAAQSAGLDMDSAAHSLGVLQRNMGMALHGGGKGAAGLIQYGIQLKDAEGKARPLTDVLGDVSEKI
jgi:hypothetical protein